MSPFQGISNFFHVMIYSAFEISDNSQPTPKIISEQEWEGGILHFSDIRINTCSFSFLFMINCNCLIILSFSNAFHLIFQSQKKEKPLTSSIKGRQQFFRLLRSFSNHLLLPLEGRILKMVIDIQKIQSYKIFTESPLCDCQLLVIYYYRGGI